jgi:tartrate dehydratase beta subunit/fumarate hydratase class I family protein
MASYTIVNPGNLVTGQPMHIEDVLNNFQALQAVVNGGLDDSNLAGISLAKIATLIFNQVSVSALWNIVHNLGKYPSIVVVDSGGTVIIPDVAYVDLNTITAGFGSPTSGKAYLN